MATITKQLRVPEELDHAIIDYMNRYGVTYTDVLVKGAQAVVRAGGIGALEENLAQIEMASRPTEYSEKLGRKIFHRLITIGPEQRVPPTITALCSDPTMPDLKTFLTWSREIPEFKEMIAEAEEIRIQAYQDLMYSLLAELTTDSARSVKDAVTTALQVLERVDPKWAQKAQPNQMGGMFSGGPVNLIFEVVSPEEKKANPLTEPRQIEAAYREKDS